MSVAFPSSVHGLLLARSSVVSLGKGSGVSGEDLVSAVELELAALGFVASNKLRMRLATCSPHELKNFLAWSIPVLLHKVGGDQNHEPLFRNFPKDIPSNTADLWWRKALVHFCQTSDQPCLFCGQVGTTHVLNPCKHVVCSNCFDGSTYSACPSCEHHVDTTSPFFLPESEKQTPREIVRFKQIDFIEDQDIAAQELFVALCKRTQPLSPVDREALSILLREYGSAVIQWIPELIPVRENIAMVLGALFLHSPMEELLPVAKRYFKTATDILRFIATASGTDGSLQNETMIQTIGNAEGNPALWDQVMKRIDPSAIRILPREIKMVFQVKRFKVTKLSRPWRRSLLEILNGFTRSNLIEDMLRHRSYWVWVGEFLHPHEYAKRYPQVAEAFEIIRKQAPDGKRSQKFRTWNSRLEESLSKQQSDTVLQLLCERPGEFARRIDKVLRSTSDPNQLTQIADAFIRTTQNFTTPVLLTLSSHLPLRTTRSDLRVYWPKSKVGLGVFDNDGRPQLPAETVRRICEAIDIELLRRFAAAPRFEHAIIDSELQNIIAPFNERTASLSAVSLPRGSKIRVPIEKTMRMFLHWCQPEGGGNVTDLDLSVAFYDEHWNYLGVCSYYQLELMSDQKLVAVSAGDLRDAPWPNGATEFVDLHSDTARVIGVKYAVMVVNNYAGIPFSQLERGFAGLMIRDDEGGRHFDPRTVKLKFNLAGENGTFMPLVLDLQDQCIHWLDVHAKGQLEMNNVANANSDITRICSTLIRYFRSGTRASMYELGLLHAASRCNKVTIRGNTLVSLFRHEDESPVTFLNRLRSCEANGTDPIPIDNKPSLGILYQGDLELPTSSSVYALFPDKSVSNVTASDLIMLGSI